MPATKNPNAIQTGQGKQPLDTVSSSALSFDLAEQILPVIPTTGSSLAYSGGPAWHDGTTNPATTIEGQIDKILTDLVASAGDDRIGAAAVAGALPLPGGSIRDNIQALVSALTAGLSATSGATRIGVAPVSGYSPRDIIGAAAGVNPGGLGNATDLGANPKLETVLGVINDQLRRRRAFTATAVNNGSTIRRADLEAVTLSSLLGSLAAQVTGQQGGVYMVHALDTATSYTAGSSASGAFPHLISEAKYGGDTAPTDETSILGNAPLQTSAGGDQAVRGVWEGFQFYPTPGAWVFYPGFEGRYNVHMNEVGLRGNAPTGRPIHFSNSYFSRSTANTTGTVMLIRDSFTGSRAVFERCIFSGGSNHTNLVEIDLQSSATRTSASEVVIFRDCVFDGTGCDRCVASTNSTQKVVFERCRFIGDPTSTEYMFDTVDENFCFIDCEFVGGPHMFQSTRGGLVRDCTFHVTVDRTDSAEYVINVRPAGAEDAVWINNKVIIDGTFGTAQSTTPVVHFDMRSTVIDGLRIEYTDTVPQLSEYTLALDYDTSPNLERPSQLSNVHIDLNHKTVKGTSDLYPRVLEMLHSSDSYPYTAENITISGVDYGNPDGDGAGGTMVLIGANTHLTKLTIIGGTVAASTTYDHLWGTLIRVLSNATISGLRLVPESGTLTPRGLRTLYLGPGSLTRDGYINMSGEDVTGISDPSVVSVVYIFDSFDRVTLRDTTIIHDPRECPTVAIDGTGSVDFPSFLSNRFLSATPVARTYPIITTLNGMGGLTNYAKIVGNHFAHRATAGNSPLAIQINCIGTLIADNHFQRITGDGGGTDWISALGSDNVERDNIYEP
jgi:hypothetical protein